jgi:succinate-semialdehyde dehydrogenase / glutarate-semialdehyde dehydrogenase
MLSQTLVALLEDDISLSPPDYAYFKVFNPANSEVLAYVRNMDADETEAALFRAQAAFKAWASVPPKARAVILKKWFSLLLENQEALAHLVSLEQGRVITEARGEVLYAAGFIEWFAEEGKRAYGRTIPSPVVGKQLLTFKEPIGVVSAITPWNFPLSMITRKLGPALAAGCPVVVKPSEETPLCALALAKLAKRAGVPNGVISIITTLQSAEVGAVMTGDLRVKKVSFTGSTPVGKKLYEACAKGVKKISLELGGNAPLIVFDDADLNLAVSSAILSKFRNAGQTCVCANRFFVQSGIYERFVEAFIKAAQSLSLGQALDEKARIGCLINQKAIDKVERLVADALAQGAKLKLGGRVDHTYGPLFYPATVLTDCTRDMALFDEEIFGPVAAIYQFDSEADAVSLSNDTPFGLAAYMFTTDLGRAFRVSSQIEAGMIGLNDGVMSTELAPFGGVKESGLGREGAQEGLDEFLQIKYISIAGLDLG